MSFHPSRSLRFSATALVALLVVAVVSLTAAAASDAASCKAGRVSWKANGKAICVKPARPRLAREQLTAEAALKEWFTGATAKKQAARIKTSRAFTRATPRAAKIAVGLLAKAKAKLASPDALSARRRPLALVMASAAAGRVVTDSITVDAGSVTLADGVKVSAKVDAKEFDDGQTTAQLTMEVAKDGDSVRYQPTALNDIGTVPQVECPTADGRLFIEFKSTVGGTTSFFSKGKLLGAFTQKQTKTLNAEGHVGRDARLHDVEATASTKVELYARGVQVVQTLTGSYTISRDGDPVAKSGPTGNVKLKMAGLSAAKEAAEARKLAAAAAADREQTGEVASTAELARWRMKGDEYRWYSIPNGCARLSWSPDSTAQLSEGANTAVEGSVEATAGGVARGEFTVQSVSLGSLAMNKALSDPGAPATFAARGADKRDADDMTVVSSVLATSTAGRAEGGWYAKADPVKVPKRFTGIISATGTGSGSSDYFDAWAEYELESVNVGPGGYVDAWYKLKDATQNEVKNVIGAPGGCRYEASSSGGAIVDGDIELRRAPGGAWEHAVMYDVELAGQTFEAKDCGPTPPPPFTSDLVGFVNMAMLGGGFKPVADDFSLEQLSLTYYDPTTQRTTVADWDFDGYF